MVDQILSNELVLGRFRSSEIEQVNVSSYSKIGEEGENSESDEASFELIFSSDDDDSIICLDSNDGLGKLLFNSSNLRLFSNLLFAML